MIKFTDEQKRELLTEYKELNKKSVEYIKKCQEEQNWEFDAVYYAEREKILQEVAFDDVEWGYIFVYSLINQCLKNEIEFSHTKWITIISLLGLFCGDTLSFAEDKLN